MSVKSCPVVGEGKGQSNCCGCILLVAIVSNGHHCTSSALLRIDFHPIVGRRFVENRYLCYRMPSSRMRRTGVGEPDDPEPMTTSKSTVSAKPEVKGKIHIRVACSPGNALAGAEIPKRLALLFAALPLFAAGNEPTLSVMEIEGLKERKYAVAAGGRRGAIIVKIQINLTAFAGIKIRVANAA